MSEIKEKVNLPQTKVSEAEQLTALLFEKSSRMISDYSSLIRHTQSMVNTSMIHAYSKGLNDAIKFLIKENNKLKDQNEKSES